MNIGGCLSEARGCCPRGLSAASPCQRLVKTGILRSMGIDGSRSSPSGILTKKSFGDNTMVGRAMAEDKAEKPVDSKMTKKGRKASVAGKSVEERIRHYTRSNGLIVHTVKSKIDGKSNEMTELEIQVEGIEDECIVPRIVWYVCCCLLFLLR